MLWTCSQCGKQLEISDEQLTENGGVVVCPQCLTTTTLPGYSIRQSSNQQPSQPQQQTNDMPQRPRTITFDDSPAPHRTATPPPYNPPRRPATPPPMPPQQQPRQTTPRPGKKKSSKSKKSNTTMSSMGCMWRSIVFTIALLALYILVGMLLNG